MTDEKWEDLKESLRQKFEVVDEITEPDILTDDVGHEVKGEKESIVFITPEGKLMITRTDRPMILDRKTHYHKTQAGGAKVEYVVSDTERVQKITLFRWSERDGGWMEVDVKADKLSF